MDTPVLIFSFCNIDKVEKVKLSQVTSAQEAANKVNQNMRQSNKVYVAVGGTITEIQCEGKGVSAQHIQITDDGKTAYYLARKKTDNRIGDLYKFTIANGVPQKAALYDTDVYTFELLDNSNILYYCNYDEKKHSADLYVNQTLVDYEVFTYTNWYDADNQRLLYLTDMDKNYSNGTLKIWEDGTIVRISDEVYTFEVVDDEVLYITEYDEEKARGTLYLFQNDESQKVDTDVSHIIGSTDQFGFVYREKIYIRNYYF